MKNVAKLLFICLSVLFFVTQTGFAQEWSKEQKEVWQTVESYSKVSHQRDLEDYLSYWHDDFLGWHNGHAKPTDKAQRSKGLKGYFAKTKSVMYQLEPLSIRVFGNIAIVQYINRQVLADNETKKEAYSQAHWTDILIKEKGSWKLIADHGGSVD